MTAATLAPTGPAAPPRWAWRPVGAIAAAVGVLLLVVSGRYGYFVDELYFMAAGRQFSWGYADQPWLLPALAHAMDTLVPGSVTVLRLPVTLAAVAGVLTTAGIAREMGGTGRAQTLAAALYASSLGMLWANHTLATHALDPALWAGIGWLLVRWTRLRDDRLLLAAAALTAVALQVKYLVPVWWAAILLGAVAFGPRRLLTRPALWAGLVLAAATAVPSLWWQATHGWPQVAMTRVIAEDQGGGLAGRLVLVPGTLLLAGLVSGAVAAAHGLYCLLRRPALAPYRYLGVAATLVIAAFVLAGGRPTYTLGVLPLLWAASATEPAARWWRWVRSWPILALSAVAGILIALPVLPVQTVDRQDPLLTGPGTTGWPGLADAVAVVAPRLPTGTVIVTASYPQAAALEHFRDGRFDEPVVSPDRGYWFLAAPPTDAPSVLVVGDVPERLRPAFTTATPLATYDNPYGIATINGRVPLTLMTGRTQPWPDLWNALRTLRPTGP